MSTEFRTKVRVIVYLTLLLVLPTTFNACTEFRKAVPLVPARIGGGIVANSISSSTSTPATGDEFVGPFPSWTNVKTVYGAKGDGATDDTNAIQNALNEIGAPGHSSVVFFPAGTYKITATLKIGHLVGVSLIGEDPTTTVFKWAGASGGTILNIDGLTGSIFKRLTFDGSSQAKILVDQSWTGGNYFDTGNQYTDDVFKNSEIGIQGGASGGGFAETTVARSVFQNLTTIGIITMNYNALDLWVWDSIFDHCYIGVGDGVPNMDGTTRINGAGNFNVNNSIFRYSTFSDILIGNVASPFSFRNNYSIGSGRFLYVAGSANTSPLTVSGNRIFDTVDPIAINIGNYGPSAILDNVIRSRAGVTSGPVVQGLNLTAIGNTFTVPSAISNQPWQWWRQYPGNGDVGHLRIYEADSSVISISSIDPTEPVLPGFEPNLHRQVFEVPLGANAATIQQIINNASAQSGNRPVVHLPGGTYNIESTLTIPANTDIQLVGDGSTLYWVGSGTGPVLYLPGPTKATLRSLFIDAAYRPYNDTKTAIGILADNIDQPGSVVYGQFGVSGGVQTNLFVNGLDYTAIEARLFQHHAQAQYPNSTSVKLVGGPLAAAGNPQSAKLNIYSGQGDNLNRAFDVSGGGRLLVRDFWYEYKAMAGFLHMTGGTVTLEGVLVAAEYSPAFDLENLNGSATFINVYSPLSYVARGNGSNARILGDGLNGSGGSPNYFANNASPSATMGRVGSLYSGSSIGVNPAPDLGTTDIAFIKSMLAQTRAEKPQALGARPAGISDLRLFGVGVAYSGTHNIVLTGNGGTSQPPAPTPTPTATVSPTPTPTSTLTPSLDGLRLPPASQIVDNSLNVWTIRISDGAILMNGQQASGGLGSVITWCGGVIRVLGTDNNWWAWDGSNWNLQSSIDVCSIAQSTPAPAPTATPAPSPTPSTNSPTFKIGARVMAVSNLSVRSKPSNNKKFLLCSQTSGAGGTIVGGPIDSGGYRWWSVDFDSGCDGWTVEKYLQVQ